MVLPRHRILGPQPPEHLVMLEPLEAIKVKKVDSWQHRRPPARGNASAS
jgi:hypothetical protein